MHTLFTAYDYEGARPGVGALVLQIGKNNKKFSVYL